MAITFTGHAGNDTHGVHPRLVFTGLVLPSLVRMHDGCDASGKLLSQIVKRQVELLFVRRVAHNDCNNLSTGLVNNCRDIAPAVVKQSDLRYVGVQDSEWFFGIELLV